MTPEEIHRIEKIANVGKQLLGDLAILRERISWLKNCEQLFLAFDRGASKPGNASAQRVPICMSDDFHSKIRDETLLQLRAELKEVESKLEALSIDSAV